jgi:hypothetical protein
LKCDYLNRDELQPKQNIYNKIRCKIVSKNNDIECGYLAPKDIFEYSNNEAFYSKITIYQLISLKISEYYKMYFIIRQLEKLDANYRE